MRNRPRFHSRLARPWLAALLLAIGLVSVWAQAPKPATGIFVAAPAAVSQVACTTTTASLASATVQAAITAAASGDVICLPAGTITWTGAVGGDENGLVTIPSTKGVTIQGAGVGSTTINSGTSGTHHHLFQIITHVTVPSRITGINFTGGTTGDTGRRFIVIHGATTNARFRVDHNAFTGGDTQINVREAQYGLMDHNAFTAGDFCEILHIYGDGSSDWTNAVVPGSADAVYVEDNTFTQPSLTGDHGASAIQSYDGARTVIRYNTFTRQQIDQHGTAGMVGARWWEIYNNTFASGAAAVADWFSFADIRAGSGVVYNNARTGGTVGGGRVWQFREEDTGYPASYQVGRGQSQAALPGYYWSNSTDFSLDFPTPTMVQLNRDIYAPTTGAALPATCTPPTAFWLTTAGGNWDTTHGGSNDGALYKCTATNVYTLYWTPYTYPHPLAAPGTFVLADCAQATVTAAIANVNVMTGDTIQCPAGAWSWSNVDLTRNVTLKGAGIGLTNISITAAFGIESLPTNTGAFRISGFTFIATSTFGDFFSATLRIRNGHNWRVDHNEFQVFSNAATGGSADGSGGNGLLVENDSAGLIDHNRFVNGGGAGCPHAMLQISNSGTTTTTLDAQKFSWVNFDPLTLLNSLDHTIFAEDNYFFNSVNCSGHNAHTMYLRHGAVLVFRHNEIHGFNADVHPFDDEHGGFTWEVSNNLWVGDVGNTLFTIMDIAAGTGVIYNNTLQGGGATNGVQFLFSRAQMNGVGNITSVVPGFGTVNAMSLCSNTEGYPCAEQPGRGQGNVSSPIYVYSNTGFPAILNGAGATFIQANRDYFLNQGTKPGYVAYTYPHPQNQ